MSAIGRGSIDSGANRELYEFEGVYLIPVYSMHPMAALNHVLREGNAMDPVDVRNAKLALAFKALNLSGSGQLSLADLESIAQSMAQRLNCDA